MEILSAHQIVDLIKQTTKDPSDQGNPSLTIHVTNTEEAAVAIRRLKEITANLKVIKRRVSHIQAQIRAEESGKFRNLLVADLLEKNFGKRFEEGNVAEKKRLLISTYKQTSLMIDDLILQSDENQLVLKDYIYRNR